MRKGNTTNNKYHKGSTAAAAVTSLGESKDSFQLDKSNPMECDDETKQHTRHGSQARFRVGATGTSVQRIQCFKTKRCRFWMEGRCTRGEGCTYAHTDVELRTPPDLTKTKLCTRWKKGTCDKSADECAYAHGTEDLRDVSGNTPSTTTSLAYGGVSDGTLAFRGFSTDVSDDDAGSDDESNGEPLATGGTNTPIFDNDNAGVGELRGNKKDEGYGSRFDEEAIGNNSILRIQSAVTSEGPTSIPTSSSVESSADVVSYEEDENANREVFYEWQLKPYMQKTCPINYRPSEPGTSPCGTDEGYLSQGMISFSPQFNSISYIDLYWVMVEEIYLD